MGWCSFFLGGWEDGSGGGGRTKKTEKTERTLRTVFGQAACRLLSRLSSGSSLSSRSSLVTALSFPVFLCSINRITPANAYKVYDETKNTNKKKLFF
jgi:hypothetical protein